MSESLDMLPSLPQSLVRVRHERGFLDDPVHAFDHAVRPVVVRLGMPFLDAIELADALEAVTDACVSDAASEAFLPCEGHAVVRQNGMYAVREGHKHLPKELRCVGFRGPVKERNMRELCDAVYGNKHVLSAAGDLHFGAVDVHEAQCRFFKLSVPSWQLRCGLSTDSVTLRASMQGGCLQDLPHEIVQRQMPLLAQCNRQVFLLLGKMLACCVPRTHGLIEHRGACTPLGHDLGVAAVELGQGPTGAGRSLEFCADTRRCAGAAMPADCHSAFSCSRLKNAP